MRDLVGHDRSPSAYLVYLHLWSQTVGRRQKAIRLSHQSIADATGLSKSAVQSRDAYPDPPAFGERPARVGYGGAGVSRRAAWINR